MSQGTHSTKLLKQANLPADSPLRAVTTHTYEQVPDRAFWADIFAAAWMILKAIKRHKLGGTIKCKECGREQ